MAAFQISLEHPRVHRPREDKAGGERRGVSEPESRLQHRADIHSADVIVGKVHRELHHRDRDRFTQPDRAERGAQPHTGPHEWNQAQRIAADEAEHGRERKRCPRAQAQSHANREADEFADGATGEAVQRRGSGQRVCEPPCPAWA